jgi:hypothetical protein
MPPIMNIIISGHASTISPNSRVVTGTPPGGEPDDQHR